MATITRYVDTDVVGGLGDGTSWANAYLTLNACEAAENQDLTDAGGDIMIINCRGTANDTTATQFLGWSTASGSYIEISGDVVNYNWDDTKYTNAPTNANGIRISENYMRIHNIQSLGTESGTGNLYCLVTNTIDAGGADIWIYNSLIKGVCSGTGAGEGIDCNDSDVTNLRIWNVIVNDFVSGTDNDFKGIGILNAGTADITNVVVHNCRIGIARTAGTVNVYNSVSFDNNDDFNGTFNTITYCASDDNDVTAGGTNVDETAGATKTWTDCFTDYANDDFHLKTGSPLIDAGTNDPLTGYGSPDIEGAARTTWDVGADEYSSVGWISGGKVKNIV